ncbi:MAG: FeoA family protein [Pirellulaceae bacterium]
MGHPLLDSPAPIAPVVDRLSSAQVGNFVCVGVDADGQSQTRMKSLGICEGRTLELISVGDPMIVRVSGSRVGLSRALASYVSVSHPSPQLARKAK